MATYQPGTLTLPWEGVESLQTILGIVDDHGLRVDVAAKDRLEDTLRIARAKGPLRSGQEDTVISIELGLAEAALLLDALKFTDLMSMDLPFYDMVADTIQFVSDQLVSLWPAETWMKWRDNTERGHSPR
jgi:hypothetical protein